MRYAQREILLSTNDSLQHFIVFLPLNYTHDDVMLDTYVVARDGKLKSNEYTQSRFDKQLRPSDVLGK